LANKKAADLILEGGLGGLAGAGSGHHEFGALLAEDAFVMPDPKQAGSASIAGEGDVAAGCAGDNFPRAIEDIDVSLGRVVELK